MRARLNLSGTLDAWKVILCFAMNLIVSQTPANAQENEFTAKSFRDRVCDIAVLSEGARLNGIAISESPARIVVRTLRLKADAPDLFANEIRPQFVTQVDTQAEKIISVLRLRIDQVKVDAPDDQQQVGLLEEVIERLKPDENRQPEFIVMEIEPKRLKKLETLGLNRRELATLALLNHIEDFENLHWKAVAVRLQAIPAEQWKKPKPTSQPIPPDVIAERILAAVDVNLNRATRLIRTGESFVEEDAKPDMAVLMSSLLGDSLNNTLQELLNETGGATAKPDPGTNAKNSTLPDSAIRMAQKKGQTTVVVSSFDFDLALGLASVTRQLFRNSKLGGWKLVSSVTGASTTSDVTAEQVQKIEDDPQIKQINGLLSQLSPDTSSLKTALQMGAVVQSASSKADAAFQSVIQDFITARNVTDDNPPTVLLKALQR